MEPEDSHTAADYALSFQTQLTGTARCICVDDSDGFVAATVDGIVSGFTRSDPSTWVSNDIFGKERLHGLKPGMMLSMCKHKKGAFVSGGTDNRAIIWTTSGGRLGQLVGSHTKPINSIAQVSNGDIVTGSNDGTAVVWQRGRPKHRLEGHEFGVEVCVLPTGEVCTASGNRQRGVIRVWRDGRCIDHNENAHQHIVRKLIRHPLGFASCGNDGYVKVWALGPPMACIMSVQAHPPLDDLDSFVYAIALIPTTSEIVSVGEDGFARILSPDGSVKQSIRHPASIRDVAALPNGDVVTACSDGGIRVWTRSSDRGAADEVLQAYQELIQLTESTHMQTLDQSQVRPITVLQNPGARPGEVVIVNLDDKGPTVFQWNQDATTWQEIGAALGKSSKPMLEGVQYDQVVDVVVVEGAPPIKLGFNVSDDPATVARAFCSRHGLGEEALPQIIAYLMPLANPVARLTAQEQNQIKTLKLIPTWKQEGFIVDSKLSTKPLETTIRASNEAISAAALTDEQLDVFSGIVNLLEKSHLERIGLSSQMAEVVGHLLTTWPLDKQLPVLDLLRMLTAVNSDSISFCENPIIFERLIVLSKEGGATHLALVLKVFSNWIAKRGAVASDNPTFAIELLCRVVDGTKAGGVHSNPAVILSYTTLLHNIMCFIGRYCKKQDAVVAPLLERVTSSLLAFFQESRKEKPTFMALLVLGTIGFLGDFGKQIVRNIFGTQLRIFLDCMKSSTNTSIKQAVRETAYVFSE